MALYRVTIPKRFVTGDFTAEPPWRNVYTIEADSYASALAAGDIIAGHEMTFHMSDVGVTEIVAHLVTEPARRVGKILVVSRSGEIAFTTQLTLAWDGRNANTTGHHCRSTRSPGRCSKACISKWCRPGSMLSSR
jgi:hypothetical protein